MLPFADGVLAFILVLPAAMVIMNKDSTKLNLFNHNAWGTKCLSILPRDNYQSLAIFYTHILYKFHTSTEIDGLTLESWRHRLGWYIHICFCEGRACIREKFLANPLCPSLFSKRFTHTHTHTHTHKKRTQNTVSPFVHGRLKRKTSHLT